MDVVKVEEEYGGGDETNHSPFHLYYAQLGLRFEHHFGDRVTTTQALYPEECHA